LKVWLRKGKKLSENPIDDNKKKRKNNLWTIYLLEVHSFQKQKIADAES